MPDVLRTGLHGRPHQHPAIRIRWVAGWFLSSRSIAVTRRSGWSGLRAVDRGCGQSIKPAGWRMLPRKDYRSGLTQGKNRDGGQDGYGEDRQQ